MSPSGISPAKWWLDLALVLVLAVVPLVGVLGNDFINLDDNLFVTRNDQVQSGITWETIRWSLTGVVTSNWHPLTVLSHALDCSLFGLNPAGHHLTSLLLHSGSAVLLWLIFVTATGDRWSSLFLAGLFAVHPLNVESVAWVASRKDVLSTFFALLSILCYVRFCLEKHRPMYWLSLLAMVVGLLAKPTLVILPLFLLLMDYWPLRRIQTEEGGFCVRRFLTLVLEKVPFLILSVLFSLITMVVHQAHREFEVHPLMIRLANASLGYVWYLGKMFWPVDLCVYYPHRGAETGMWQAGLGAVLLVVISLVVFIFRKQRPHWMAGWVWYVGGLLPVIGIIPVNGHSTADRYAYLPLIGIFALLIWSIPKKWFKCSSQFRILAAGGLVVLCLLGFRTASQVSYWRDSVTLFQYTLQLTSPNALAEAALGDALLERGELEEAIAHLSRSVELRPLYSDAHYGLGIALLRQGKPEEAIQPLRRAAELEPKNPLWISGRALAEAQLGDAATAKELYGQALLLDNRCPEALNGIGAIYFKEGELEEAVVSFQKALQARPGYAEAHNSLGAALATLGQNQPAIEHLLEAVRLAPDLLEAQANLAALLLQVGRGAEAEPYLLRALEGNPGSLKLKGQLALSYAMQGRTPEAVEGFEAILKEDPRHMPTLHYLGLALAQMGRLEEAREKLEAAVAIDPTNPELLGLLEKVKADLTSDAE